MDSFTSNNIDTHKNYDLHDAFHSNHNGPEANKTVPAPEPIKTENSIKQDDNVKEESAPKKRRAYTRRNPDIHSPESSQAKMKLFSVYVANGWNRVDGTLIAETEDIAKKQAFKILKIEESEQEGATVLINEIKTGIHLVQ